VEPDDRKAFDAILAELFGALDKPLTDAKRDAFWKGLQRMGILEFARCRDHILAKLETGEPPKNFGVSQVWDAKRELRAKAPIAPAAAQSEPEVDVWEAAGNQHLLAHIRRRLALNPQHFGRPATLAAMRQTTREKFPHADASPDFVQNVKRLVRARNAWVADMRDVAVDGGVPVETQKSIWNEYIASAEQEIRARMAA
jgi:hypothetical protein